MRIDWNNFQIYNHDSRGIRFKFEDLCRQLFANENLQGNKQFRYLHSNPNNYGLETEPIYNEINKQWVGFQAKFFDGVVNYNQIKESADKIVKYYTGKEGTVNLVYIFCNKPISVTAKSFVEVKNLLKAYSIEVQLITDNAILDLVRNKYPYLAFYYFGNNSLDSNWFITHADYMFKELGERYNKRFNVETEFENELSLFVHDQDAVALLNKRKNNLAKAIGEVHYNREKYKAYLGALKETIDILPDVTIETLYSALKWEEQVKANIHSFYEEYKKEYQELIEKKSAISQLLFDRSKSEKEQENLRKEYRHLSEKISNIEYMLELPEMLSISDREKQLLYGKVLTLHGKAGTGKSQLLAIKTQSLLDSNRTVLLLVAGIYFSDDPISNQIMKNLELDYSFEELIDLLEVIGERDNCIVPIFIDGINETWNRRLWKSGLSSIVEKIKQTPMVKLVISYRTEYEKLILPDFIRERKKIDDIVSILHRGFEENSIDAVKEFMNHYGIPFSPLEYFSYEMTNPLFLTLYCKTYNGKEVSLPILYERIIENANSNIHKSNGIELRAKGYSGDENLLSPLITQIAEFLISHNERSIIKENLLKLSYWTDYGLVAGSFVNNLVKEHILHDSFFDGKETFYFAYDQMNDYYCAKSIIKKYELQEDLRTYLSQTLLGIEDGKLKKPWNVDLFINVCALYVEKYGEECIDIIDALSEDDRSEIMDRYIDSFQWREEKYISKEQFITALQKYSCDPDRLWKMLIGNSVKEAHPLNADFLHELLSRYKLNYRDYLWTVFINKLTLDDSNRIVQLVQMYDRGEKLVIKNKKQLELLLTLFGWLLTSSNRWLRDYTSKAMVEILKENLQLCQIILEKFRGVNDPYVIQRLYGVVFGACCKKAEGDYQSLAEYVYETVFNQDKVYPDILLRDYARLIIERFLWEKPNYSGIIKREKIVPPYESDPIPEIEDQHYLEKEYNGALFWVMHSMRFEGMGMYGDFGRYVFQRALQSFDIDEKKIFNYAVYYILNHLGFNEEYFGDHDKHCGSYDRHITSKLERIGKKYQWIAMYNILARVSDHYKMIDRWGYPEKEEVAFEGAWDPYVRDFDPTLNQNYMVCKDAPIFAELEAHIEKGIKENIECDISTPESQSIWLKTKGVFFEELKSTLIISENNQKWICLTRHCDTRKKELQNENHIVWSWLYAYFMTPDQAKTISQFAEKGMPLISSDVASHHETYTVFNREYPWSPSCKEFEENAWIEMQVSTGEYETITEPMRDAIPSDILKIIRAYSGYDGEVIPEDANFFEKQEEAEFISEDEASLLQPSKVTTQREIKKEIGHILHATTDLLWEEEYDATKEEALSYSFPCAELVKEMELRQAVSDGFLYTKDGKLAAFDTYLTQKINCVVVRKEILDSFLEKTGLKLVWLVDAEKQILLDNSTMSQWSDWEAVFVYEGSKILGDIHRLPQGNSW